MSNSPRKLARSCAHDSAAACLVAAGLSARNGFEYAVKLRLAHCVVMTVLYGHHRSPLENILWVLRSAREHGISLGSYAFVYKILRCILDRSFGSAKLNPAVAGYLFVADKGSLQSSLRQAMELIYDTDETVLTEPADLVPFLHQRRRRRGQLGEGDVDDVLEDVLENMDPEEF